MLFSHTFQNSIYFSSLQVEMSNLSENSKSLIASMLPDLTHIPKEGISLSLAFEVIV